MKQKILLSLLFVCSLVVTSKAQINKEAIWLGGQFAFSQSTDKSIGLPGNNKTTAVTFNPAIGKAVKDNLVAGITLSYQYNKSKSGSTTTSKYNSYGGGFFIRKYVPVISQLYLFGDARLFVSNSIEKGYGSNGNFKNKTWDVSASVSPGISYAVTKSIHIETGVYSLFTARYQKKDQKQGVSQGKLNTFSTGLLLDNNSPIFIGFRFLINKKA